MGKKPLPKLTSLKLHQNELGGEIPETICNLVNLTFALEDEHKVSGIFDNKLCPPYPTCIEDFIGEQDTNNCEE